MNTDDPRISVSVITGFLGSGKTTLLNSLLKHPQMEKTAVIVNEFGDIGIDHELIETSDENTILLSSGCVCCTVRGDLVETLGDLSVRRLKQEIPAFTRVVIETTGLADPMPILHALMSVPVVNRYRLDSVVTTVDAVNGAGTLQGHEEAVKQAAIADHLVITKTDLTPQAAADRLVGLLRELNTEAPTTRVINGEVAPDQIFGSLPPAAKSGAGDAHASPEPFGHDEDAGSLTNLHHQHGTISSFCLTFDEPLDWRTVALWLDSLVAIHGKQLLRIKGIIDVEGIAEPIVIHAVQHLFHPPARLKSWPGPKRQSRIVFITQDVPRVSIESALRRAQEVSRAP